MSYSSRFIGLNYNLDYESGKLSLRPLSAFNKLLTTFSHVLVYSAVKGARYG